MGGQSGADMWRWSCPRKATPGFMTEAGPGWPTFAPERADGADDDDQDHGHQALSWSGNVFSCDPDQPATGEPARPLKRAFSLTISSSDCEAEFSSSLQSLFPDVSWEATFARNADVLELEAAGIARDAEAHAAGACAKYLLLAPGTADFGAQAAR